MSDKPTIEATVKIDADQAREALERLEIQAQRTADAVMRMADATKAANAELDKLKGSGFNWLGSA